ncbi:hypothetical protein BKA93DRAFT_835607 [Sparassis latifolia]
MASPKAAKSPWAINELLIMVLAHLDMRSLARSACVCMRWSEIALDMLWRDVDDLMQLLALLAPFGRPEKSTTLPHVYSQKFKKAPTRRDWDRFQRYACRVRKLSYEEYVPRTRRRCVDPSALNLLANWYPTSEIFPNLQSLTWCASTPVMQQLSVVFMHARLKRLEIGVYNVTAPPLAEYFQQIIRRIPLLPYLALRLPQRSSIRDTEEDVVRFIRGLRHLQLFVAPIYGLTSRIAAELSKLPHLDTISLSPPIELGNGDRTDVSQFAPILHDHAFPSLKALCMCSQITFAIQLFSGRFSPVNITYLCVHVLAVVDPLVVQQFFTVIKDRCHLLSELHVDFMIHPDSPISVLPPPVHERPSMETFRPLLSCRRLTRFEFRWDYPLNLTDRDMEEFATGLPYIETFILNCDAIIEFSLSSLTPKALLPFARHCPRLRRLGLYLNATGLQVPLPTQPTLAQFARLEKLYVGVSDIDRVEPVVLFLSQLCALGCEIIAGLRWPDAFGITLDRAGIVDDRRARMTQACVRWMELGKVLPLVIKARMDEKARMAALHGEVARLTTSRLQEKERSDRLQREVQDLRVRHGHRA